MREEVHHRHGLPDAVAREVDDDVVALGDAQLVGLSDGHRARQQVAVVGDLDHRRGVGERDLEEARHGAVQDAEAVLAPLDLEERPVDEVHRHHIGHETRLGVEDVESELAVRVPGLVREHQVDVVVEIAEVLRRAARQPQVHAVVDRLVAAIERAVDVEHPGIALVHVLRGEAEHVVVEPVRAHGFFPIARNLGDAA